MPLIKKLIKLGNSSRAVVIPSGWLNYYEKKMGCTIENVLLTVKGDNIIIAVDNSLPGMVATKGTAEKGEKGGEDNELQRH